MKINKDNIKGYYQNEDIAQKYIDRRFSGKGGAYVNNKELSLMLKFPKNFLKDKKVIDLATGTGRLALSILKSNPIQLIALDASPQMLKNLEPFKKKNLILKQGLAEKMPLEDSSYDALLSLRLFEHLKVDMLNKVIKEANRVLKPGGKLVFNTVNNSSIEAAIVKRFGASSSSVYPIKNSDIKNILKKNGFKVEKEESAFIFPRGIFLHLPNSIAGIVIFIEDILSKTPLKTFSCHKVWYSSKR